MSLPSYLVEDETYIYCKTANIAQVKALADFIPLSNDIEDANVRDIYYNVIGFLNGKQVVIME